MKYFYCTLQKDMNRFVLGTLVLIIGMNLVSCKKTHEREIIWHKNLPSLGTFSSIKCSDLNQDGVLDVVMGAGKNEFEESESGVIALNGKTGDVLWTVPCKDQMVGTAAFLNIDNDGVDDLIIGGRAAQLFAISGKTGAVIWSYKITNHQHDAQGYLRFNFYTPQVLDDVDSDQIQDILITNGGNIAAQTNRGRYPGVLAIMSGATGAIIAIDTMPDGHETYMSPVLFKNATTGKHDIIFGTGGETVGGSLYKTTLQDLRSNDISKAEVLLTKEAHGFIAPPVLVDLNQDNSLDIICNWHGGEMVAIDGLDHQIMWTVALENTELNNMPTPGDVNFDGIPDFFSSFSQGVWPKSTGTVQVIVDGHNGKIIHRDTFGCVGFSTALSYDMNGDGAHEFLWNSNSHNCTGIYLGATNYQMHVLDFANQKESIWYPEVKAKNIGSTPWIGDADGDQNLDVFFCLQSNSNDIFSYYDIHIFRMTTGISVNEHPSWTEYLGN